MQKVTDRNGSSVARPGRFLPSGRDLYYVRGGAGVEGIIMAQGLLLAYVL